MATQTMMDVRTNQEVYSRMAILADATLCAVVGGIAAVASSSIASLMGVQNPTIMLVVGLVVLAYAGWQFFAVGQPRFTRIVAWENIVIGALWVAGSVVLLTGSVLALTPAGWWTVLLLADAVIVLGILQYIGLRRSR